MSLKKKHLAFIRAARVGHLATADTRAEPHVVPICFVFNGKEFYSVIDEKPKRLPAERLKRVRNVQQNPKVSLVIDRYAEEWRRLAYVLVTGTATILSRGTRHQKAVRLLRRKYPQYRAMAIHERPMIAVKPLRITFWGDFTH